MSTSTQGLNHSTKTIWPDIVNVNSSQAKASFCIVSVHGEQKQPRTAHCRKEGKMSQKEGKTRAIFFSAVKQTLQVKLYEHKGVIMKQRPVLLQLTKRRSRQSVYLSFI